MLKALVYKELRETGWIALVALAAYFACGANAAGYPVVPFMSTEHYLGVPFIEGPFLVAFVLVSLWFAITLGLTQTARESSRGTWLFLLHRPLSRRQLLAVKLATGGGLYLTCSALGILGYALWAATPGTHASPFEWWMTAMAWRAWAVIALMYLAAFLAGIRPARWFGTRLLPLAAAGVAAMLLAELPIWPLVGLVGLALTGGCLAVLIDFTAQTRDFS